MTNLQRGVAGIACGSSHSIAWAPVPNPFESTQFEPISFPVAADALGAQSLSFKAYILVPSTNTVLLLYVRVMFTLCL